MINAYCIGGSIVNGWGTDLDIHWDNILRNTTSLKHYTLPDGTATYASFLDNEQSRPTKIVSSGFLILAPSRSMTHM